MSDAEFAGLDFALGTVRGFRTWNVDIAGKLSPLHQTGQWVPGENRAVCRAYGSKEKVPEIEGETFSDRQVRVKEWQRNHEMIECQHGFYAYFDGTNLQADYKPTVNGVIEGYGEVLIGTKGFRASKARILALSIEPYAGMWNLDQFVVDKIRRNYPGIPFFESAFAMQAEYPADVDAAEVSA